MSRQRQPRYTIFNSLLEALTFHKGWLLPAAVGRHLATKPGKLIGCGHNPVWISSDPKWPFVVPSVLDELRWSAHVRPCRHCQRHRFTPRGGVAFSWHSQSGKRSIHRLSSGRVLVRA